MRYVILVVVLEYFSTKRVKALIITNIGTTFVNFAFTMLLEIKVDYPQIIIPWREAFRYQGMFMVGAVIASGIIRTLDLEPEPDAKRVQRHHHHHQQYSDFSPKDWKGLLKDITFYLYAFFFLLYDFGE